jgi:hypothetical protein
VLHFRLRALVAWVHVCIAERLVPYKPPVTSLYPSRISRYPQPIASKRPAHPNSNKHRHTDMHNDTTPTQHTLSVADIHKHIGNAALSALSIVRHKRANTTTRGRCLTRHACSTGHKAL